jgi:hypothetical protein
MAAANPARCSRCSRVAPQAQDEAGYWLTMGTTGGLEPICPGCLTVAENIALADFDVVGMVNDPTLDFVPSREPSRAPALVTSKVNTS